MSELTKFKKPNHRFGLSLIYLRKGGKGLKTKLSIIKSVQEDEEKIKEAAEFIKNGGTVVFPTETVYGLGADALNSRAVEKIFKAKGRPQDNPLIIHVSSKNIEAYVKEIPEVANKLISKFWPGPLTIILKKKDIVPNITSANLDSIGVRMPDNEIARKLIELSNTPIAAPSANISGRPSPTDFQRCVEDLDGKVDYILGGSRSDIGVESTIVDCTVVPPVVLRPGGITLEMLREVDSRIEIDKAIMQKPTENLKPKAPGMKYRHYAPNAKVTIISGERKKTVEKIREMVHYNIEKDKIVCILTVEENVKEYTEGISIVLGSIVDLSTVAQSLFEALRKCDDLGADLILAEGYEEKGVGIAIMNRLNKAAGFDIIEV
jgi:L-threonylcarbamoyladenylate synthase